MLSHKIVLANWKMKLSYEQTIELANLLKNNLKNYKLENIDIGICTDFLTIPELSKTLKDTQIKLGSQNVSWEKRGAYTGEISIDDLKYLNVEFIIIGHSERRKYLSESDEMINKKIKQIIKNKMTPVLCVGENFEQRRSNQKDLVIIKQIKSALSGIKINEIKQLIVAYEPIWVIGSGQAIKASEAEHTNKVIRGVILDSLNLEDDHMTIKEIEEKIRLIYGGSIDSSNITDFIKQPNIQGVLVGNASLNIESFMSLINTII